MQQMFDTKKTVLAVAISLALGMGLTACGGGDGDTSTNADGSSPLPWMTSAIIDKQAAATTDDLKEKIAGERTELLLNAMTLAQKMQQLTGAEPELVPELPQCYGGRHVTGIATLKIPTLRITNGPVGVGQNDCVDPSTVTYPTQSLVNTTSAKATALPSALGAAASFDPSVAAAYGEVIGTEMNNLALHVFEAPGLNMARLPILGRNFEYFGEDPYLTGAMGVAETKAIQKLGLIAMPKHFVGNEQEVNRSTIQQTVDPQVLREIYLLPFEMAVRDGKAASVMCAYNYLNGVPSCESGELLTDILRTDWGFTGYVQTDFYAQKSTVQAMLAGLDHEMPTPVYWTPAKLSAGLASGALKVSDIDTALRRRYTQMFKYGVFDRPIKQTPIDYAAGGVKARDIGVKAAVLLQNNGALPFDPKTAKKVVLVGKQTQIYAQQGISGGTMLGKPMGTGLGSSDVVPTYEVKPLEGIQNALTAAGSSTKAQLILVDDANSSATIDGVNKTFAEALQAIAGADAVIVMAGTVSEEGADRAQFQASNGKVLVGSAVAGSSLDWYVDHPKTVSTPTTNTPKNSQTVAMLKAILGATSTTGKAMHEKTALVMKDNGGIQMDPALVGATGPAIMEVWFPGQEDGNIVADLVFGLKSPAGKLPVTIPFIGKGFLDHVTARQYPGVPGSDGVSQEVTYEEKLHIGYRWYDGNQSGECAEENGVNPCVAFPFGHGLTYGSKNMEIKPELIKSTTTRVSMSGYVTKHDLKVTVTNKDTAKAGTEVVQVYVSLPAVASTSTGAKQPPKRLVAFQKVDLAPGASKVLTFSIQDSATKDYSTTNHPLAIWSEAYNMWVIPSGAVKFLIGTSSSTKNLQVVTTTQ